MVPITVWSTLVWPGMTVSLQTSGTVYRSSCRDITGRLHDVSVASDCSVDRYPAYILEETRRTVAPHHGRYPTILFPILFLLFYWGQQCQMFWMNNRSGQHSKTTSQQSTVRR